MYLNNATNVFRIVLFFLLVGFAGQVRGQVDLQITKFARHHQTQNNITTFVITVRNIGTSAATDVVVTDNLSTTWTFNNLESNRRFSHGEFSAVNGNITWDIPYLASNDVAVLIFNASNNYHDWQIQQNQASVANTAIVTWNGGGPVSTGTVFSSVDPQSVNMSLTKTVDNQNPTVGTQITFTITLQKISGGTNTNLQVIDKLPPGFGYISHSFWNQQSNNALLGTYDHVSGLWDLGYNSNNLNSGNLFTLYIIAEVLPPDPSNPFHYRNMAAITQIGPDTDISNNIATLTVTTMSSVQADLEVTQNINNSPPFTIGDQVTFTITASNLSGLDATGVLVNNNLANGFQFESAATPSTGTFDPNTGVWTIGDLGSGNTATLELTATVLGHPGAAYVNVASITGNQPDLNQINNNSYTILSPTGATELPCDINAETAVFHEDFGSGSPIFGGELPPGVTNLEYFEPPQPASSPNLEDGQYVIAKNAQHAFINWQSITDRSDPNGYMMIVNADIDPHEFFKIQITDIGTGELCTNTRYKLSFWAINVNSAEDYTYCTDNEGALILPEIGYLVRSIATGEILGAGTSGQLPYHATAQWAEYDFVFTTGPADTEVELILFNMAPGGCGNDLAIDDISVYACLTDPIDVVMSIDGDSDTSTPCEGASVVLASTDPPAVWTSTEYQWQYSADSGTTWEDIAGATGDSYTIESFTSANSGHYRVLFAQAGNINRPTCRYATPPIHLEVGAVLPLNPIEGSDVACINRALTLTNDTPGGIWSTGDPALATVDATTGVVTGVSVGTVTISYTVSHPVSGCPSVETMELTIRNCKLVTNPMLIKRVRKSE